MKKYNIELSAIIEAATEEQANTLATTVAAAVNGTRTTSAWVTACDVEVVVLRRPRGPVLAA